MTNGNEYKGKTKLGIIAALCAVFSIWLMIVSKIVLAAVVMITLAVFLFIGFRAAKYIFIVLQFTRGFFAATALTAMLLSTEGSSFSEVLYYVLYLVYAVVSIVMLFADKDIREFYRK